MRRERISSRLVAVLLSIGLLAAGCTDDSGSNDVSSTPTTSKDTPKGGTLIVGAEQEPDCLDWIGTCSGSSWGYWMVAVQTMPRAFDIVKDDEGTYEYKPNILLTGEPKLETDPVQKITYEISPDAVWNDGQPITSSDFKYTWDQIANTEDVYDKTGYELIAGVDDSNPKRAVVTFKDGQSFGDWKGLFTGNYGIFPSHLLKGKDRNAEMKDGYKFSGGPWILDGWAKTDNITLVPNPKFWGTKANLDKVIFKIQADTSAEFTAFKSKQTSVIYPQPQLDAVDQINAGLPGTKKAITANTGNFEALWLNNGKAPFDDVNVRKAVAYAVDRAAIVQRLFGALGVKKPLQDLNAPIVDRFTDPDAYSKYKLDLAMVDKLLTTAGYAKGADGIYAKGGKKLSFAVRTTAGNKRRETTQQILQQQFKAAGIEMTVDNQKAGDLFGKSLPVGDFEATIYASVLTTLQPSTCNLFCTKNSKPVGEKGGNNYTRTRIPALDEQLLKMDAELDEAEMTKLGKAASKISADNVISLPIDPLPSILLWNDNVVGDVADNALLGPFWNINTWGVTS